jgi:hypothetical protein
VTAARALLEEIIDYAGLFPPAGLSIARAVENHAEYAHGAHEWMLGKFVLPVNRLDEFAECCKALPASRRRAPFELSLIIGPDVQREIAAVRDFLNAGPDFAEVRSLEIKAATATAVRDVRTAVEELPEVSRVFVEIPASDPRPLIETIAATGLCAKLRTGGVTAEAFPSASQVVGFMRECLNAGVPFKATAGLHHPICATYPLTYANHAPSAPMFGFLNVFLAAGALSLGGSDDDALAILEDNDPSAFTFTQAAVAWRDIRWSVTAIERLRVRGAISFGSCSFTEPVADLERMGVLT